MDNYCGNKICEIFESASVCSQDCAGLSLVTSTDTTGNGGASGLMFMVKSLRDIDITSLSIYFHYGEAPGVQIWGRSGSYKNYELSSNGWNLIFNSGSVSIPGQKQLVKIELTSAVRLSKDSDYSFYIYVSGNSLMYLKGTTEFAVFKVDDALQVLEGQGVTFTSPFVGSNSDLYPGRAFLGVVGYNAA